mgnify:CR=1 FL=1
MFTGRQNRFRKKLISICTGIALLLGSAFLPPFSASADDWGGGGSNQLKFDDVGKTMGLITSVKGGSTAPNRIRSIGWYVTITTSDGRSSSAVLEKNGDNGYVLGLSA